MINSDIGSILHRFGDAVVKTSKIASPYLDHSHLMLLLGVIPFEFQDNQHDHHHHHHPHPHHHTTGLTWCRHSSASGPRYKVVNITHVIVSIRLQRSTE